MAEYFYDVTPRGIIFLGYDPYAAESQRLVGALNNVPDHDCDAEGCEPRCIHEMFSIVENQNGFRPFPAFWISGDCATARSGYHGPVPSVEVPEGTSEEEAKRVVLKKLAKD